jgi:hypothetical protein
MRSTRGTRCGSGCVCGSMRIMTAICDPGETAPLARYGITEIALITTFLNVRDPAGNLHVRRGSCSMRDGRHSIVEEIGFRTLR